MRCKCDCRRDGFYAIVCCMEVIVVGCLLCEAIISEVIEIGWMGWCDLVAWLTGDVV